MTSDGKGTQLLTSSMIQSGTAGAPNVYQNFLIRSQLSLINIHDVTITKCDIADIPSANGISLNNCTNVSIIGNNFHDLMSSNGIGANPTPLIGCHFDGNTFTNVFEPIHLSFGQSGASKNNTVCNNYINGYGRIGIELQDAVNGLKVNSNYITNRINTGKDSGGLMAISCATCPTPPPAGIDSHNIEIADNTLIGPAWYTGYASAVEVYGSGTNVHDNYLKQWPLSVFYDWTGVSGKVAWFFTNNTLVGVGQPTPQAEGFATTPDVSPTVSGSKIFALADPNAPAVPTPVITTPVTTVPTPAPMPTPTFTASAKSDGVHGTVPAVGGTWTWTATGNTTTPIANPTSSQTHSIVVPAGQTVVLDQTVPDGWEVYVNYTGSPVGILLTAVKPQSFPPPVVVTPPPPPVVIPPVTIGHSRDGGKTWTVDVNVQP